MRDYYRKRAPYYDRVYTYPERADDLAYLQAQVGEHLCGRRVLEIAAGTGYWTQYIAAQAASVVATDVTEEALAIARTRPGVAKVEFRTADAYTLEGIEPGFDALFAGLWISHVPRQQLSHFLESVHRLLVPGSRVLFIDNSRSQCKRLPITHTDHFGNTYQDRKLDDGSIHRVLKNFPSESELLSATRAWAAQHDHRQLKHFWLYRYDTFPTP